MGSYIRQYLNRALLPIVAILGLQQAAIHAADRPNLVFLIADDMRPDAIAALGHPVVKTPNLDRLVERGFVFHNAYCMGSTIGAVCSPSRHMIHSGMSLYRYDPKKKEGTIGDVFRQAGYETYHLSKRGNTPQEYHKAFEHSGYVEDNKERTSGQHGRTLADRTIAFLQNGWNKERPLFMYLGFEGPHDPRVAANEWMSLYQRNQIPLPVNYKPFHPIDNGWMAGRDEMLAPWPRTEDEVRKQLHDYYGCISSIDHNVGRILKAFEDLGELDNTVVMFTSDHGLAMGSHGLFGKQNLYEHSMRSPLIFAGPGVRHGETDAFAYLFDLYPTAAELCGVKVPSTLEGRSQTPVIRGEKDSVRDTIFLTFEQGQRAVRQGDWKLFRFPLVNYSLLFNLKDDPNELHSLAEDPAQAGRLVEMMALLEEQQRAYDDPHPHTSATPGTARIDLSFFDNPPPVKTNKPAKAKRPKP
jgi:arylsulfatase A-like enzyme